MKGETKLSMGIKGTNEGMGRWSEMGTRTWGRNMLIVTYVYENVLK